MFRAEKPVSVWNKPLKLNFKDFFIALTGTVVDIVKGDIASLPKDIVEIASSLSIETKTEECVWMLICRSITSAIRDLVDESRDLFISFPEDTTLVCNHLDFSLEEKPVIIDENLFNHPGDLPFLQDIRIVFREWLICCGLDEAQANSISARLRSYFVFALNNEWISKPSDYEIIRELVNTPFTKAEKRERDWNKYNAWLQKQIDVSMFDEAFSLNQVYVPLRAYYITKYKDISKEPQNIDRAIELESDKGFTCHIVDMQTELDKWLEKGNKEDAIRVISGGPGCGKSSFAKMYAVHVALRGETKVLFIPLHRFDPQDDLIHAVGSFAINTDHFDYNPFSPADGEKRLLIIFDGLDEISKQGKVGADIAQQFIREIEMKVNQRNNIELRVQVLLSGRTLFVQANATEFRQSEQILNVLPYYESPNFARSIYDPKRLLEIDQRDLWWNKYGIAAGGHYDCMPDKLKSKELQDVTSEPLLNYLFALSYTKGNFDLTDGINLNSIYSNLLNQVYKRGYSDNRLRRNVPEMSEDDFSCVLEEIGLSAWHGNGRTTTISEIMNCCNYSGNNDLLEKLQEGAKKGVTRLLAAFYFREADEIRGTEHTFEFTHKSFGEYLAVKRIMRLLKLVNSETRRRISTRGTGWDYEDALCKWAWLFGPSPITTYIFDFLCREIQQQDKENEVKPWQETLQNLISYMLKNGMPMEKARDRITYFEQKRQARNAEEALLAVLNACARSTEDISHIKWPNETSAGEWIHFLQGQRWGGENRLVLNCLSFLDLDNSVLDGSDFYETNFEHSSMKMVRLYSAFMSFACLVHTNLNGSNLEYANLNGSNLEYANLNGAKLEYANLSGADLGGADISHASLKSANFTGASFVNTDLKHANLRNANLQRAKLGGADLSGAKLEGANLDSADVRGAKLENTYLKGANLEGAIFTEDQLSKSQLLKVCGVPVILDELNNPDHL